MNVTPLDIYRLSSSYIVRIGDSAFEMDDEAKQPNGVNMYAGAWSHWADLARDDGRRVDMVPKQVAITIAERVIQVLQAESGQDPQEVRSQ